MKKKIAGLALAASLLAALPVSSAQAQELHCLPAVPDRVGCLVKCLVNWTAYFATHGTGPGYGCADA